MKINELKTICKNLIDNIELINMYETERNIKLSKCTSKLYFLCVKLIWMFYFCDQTLRLILIPMKMILHILRVDDEVEN